jgi:DNA sulfur modification protein DndB
MASGDVDFTYSFPAIRGVQAGREFFTSMCPLKLIPRIFVFDDEDVPAEFRSQRALNRSRIPEMARYLVENRESYVFSAITASIDAQVTFEPVDGLSGPLQKTGTLRVPMTARFIINDGQHRRAAIEEALRIAPEMGDESMAVVFFVDQGLKHCQQMFADLNRYAVKPSASIGVLYDHRDELADIVRKLVFNSPVFRELVEVERTTLSIKSRKLFTMSAIYSASRALVGSSMTALDSQTAALVESFWLRLPEVFPDWLDVQAGRLNAEDTRREKIHASALVLQAAAVVVRRLLDEGRADWPELIQRFKLVDWSRRNEVWEGKATINGRVSKARENVSATADYLYRVAVGRAGAGSRSGVQS